MPLPFSEQILNLSHIFPSPNTDQVYPRPNGEMYLCGLGGSDYVDPPRLKAGGDCDKPEVIKPDPARVTAATNSFKGMTSIGNEAPSVTQVRFDVSGDSGGVRVL